MTADAVTERKNYYLGETVNQLRHGYGLYFYSNKFFRYEGDWQKGKKHGHGKLIMADGSYYEGEFKNGEIEGHGFRKWQATGNSYSGEFLKGEMHGHGVMNYVDGSQYQGEFQNNQRHGNGILQDRDGNEYEGSWCNNKKHGQGIQIYQNGDEYEGDFVDGQRHGQGDLNCVDGSVYEGQWRADMFNGQGSFAHCSGVSYEGIWLNGRPENDAASISIEMPLGQKYIEVLQGRKFNLKVQVLDAHGNAMTGEIGREFQVSAGYRFLSKTSQSQSLLELIEDMEDKPIPTPFGYDVLPYPLVDTAKDFDESEELMGRKKQRQSPVSVRVPLGGDTIHETYENESETPKPLDKDRETVEELEAGSTISESKYTASETQLDMSGDAGEEAETSISQLVPPATQRSHPDGVIEFRDLLLPAAPSNYRPFGLDGEKRSKGSRTASAASTSSTNVNETKASKLKSKTAVEERGAKAGEYVIIVQEVTQPPFLNAHLASAFAIVKVVAPKKTGKKPPLKK